MTRTQAAKYIQETLGNNFDVRVEDWPNGDRMILVREMPNIARFWIEVSPNHFDHAVTDYDEGSNPLPHMFGTVKDCADYVITKMRN